jgi:hypothetical protein
MEDSDNKFTLNENIIDYYFRSSYFVILIIIISIIYKKTDYIYQIYTYIENGIFNSYVLLLNLIALYFIFYKIKFRFTFSITYN